MAGEIVSGDAAAGGLAIGDKVCALVAGGGYAEYCVAPAAQCLPIPRGLSDIEAAGLPETYFTVWSNVFDRGRLAEGEALLVHGGASGIGTTAIQLARAMGNPVYATVGSDERARAVEALAARGINYKTQDFVKEVLDATGGRGVDVVLDMVAGDYIGRDIQCLADDGRIVIIAQLGGAHANVDTAQVMRRRLTITGSTLRPRPVAFKGAIARAARARLAVAGAGRHQADRPRHLPAGPGRPGPCHDGKRREHRQDHPDRIGKLGCAARRRTTGYNRRFRLEFFQADPWANVSWAAACRRRRTPGAAHAAPGPEAPVRRRSGLAAGRRPASRLTLSDLCAMTSVENRARLVLGNWKMNGNLAENAALLTELRAVDAASHCQIGVCVPFPYLAQAASALTGSSVSWGAQDVSAQEKGAYTGEVSGAMLKEFGCRWALAGHSERRVLHGETDQIVADKSRAALAAGLTPVVCVGESLADRDAGNTLAVIERQLKPVLALGAEAVSRMVLAYEPVWAIGTGRSASPEQAQEVHGAIRAARALGAAQVQVLYGGSVKAANAASLFAMADIDGALVGGASLVADEFLRIAAI